MKYNGQKLYCPAEELIVFPRPNGDIAFKARGVSSLERFSQLCPPPKPPVVVKPGEKPGYNLEDDNYKAAMSQHQDMHTDWLVIESLKATPELEWETVVENNPGTWGNWKQELKDAGFCDTEIVRIVHTVMAANALDDKKLEAARKHFLASQEKQVEA